MFHPPTWYCGSTASTESPGPISAIRENDRFVQKQLACVSTAPFGFAVVPEVKIMSSASSSATSRWSTDTPCRVSLAGDGTSASTP